MTVRVPGRNVAKLYSLADRLPTVQVIGPYLQSNALHICTRPKVLIKGKRSCLAQMVEAYEAVQGA